MAEVRLQKWMAQCGAASRRRSEELIAAGKVTVNGIVVREQGVRIDPEKDLVCLNGKPLQQERPHRYYMYYKPAGVLTTTSDPQRRTTIFDQLPELRGQVVPVGRLDMDTRGLLLLTNDGELTYRLTHPSWEVPKTYVAVVAGKVSNRALRQLANGVLLDDGMTAPADVRLMKQSSRKSTIELTIHEGRKREVRRMCRAVGHPVQSLLRVRFGGLSLSKLAEGDMRPLKKSEVAQLKSLVDL